MSALTLYLSSTATSSPFPTTSRLLVTSAPSSEVQLGPGEFDSGLPGNTDAGQWNPSSPIADTTAAAEINVNAAVPGTTRQGWLYNVDLAGQTMAAGTWTVQLRLDALQGTGTTGRIFLRVTIVTGSGGLYTTVANLLTTNIVGEASHAAGQEGWRAQSEARITVTSTPANFSVTFDTSAEHTFASGERILVELGFGDANNTTDRTWALLYNTANSFVTTPDIAVAARTGSGSGTVAAQTGDGDATETVSGSGSASASVVIGDGDGVAIASGAGAGSVTPQTGAATAVAIASGDGSGAASAQTGIGTGTVSDAERTGGGTGSASAQVGGGAATATAISGGTGASSAQTATGSGAAFASGSGTATATAQTATGAVTALLEATGAATASSPMGAGTGLAIVVGVGAGTVVAQLGSGAAEIDTGAAIATGTGAVSAQTGGGGGGVLASGAGAGVVTSQSGVGEGGAIASGAGEGVGSVATGDGAATAPIAGSGEGAVSMQTGAGSAGEIDEPESFTAVFTADDFDAVFIRQSTFAAIFVEDDDV